MFLFQKKCMSTLAASKFYLIRLAFAIWNPSSRFIFSFFFFSTVQEKVSQILMSRSLQELSTVTTNVSNHPSLSLHSDFFCPALHQNISYLHHNSFSLCHQLTDKPTANYSQLFHLIQIRLEEHIAEKQKTAGQYALCTAVVSRHTQMVQMI